MKKKTTRRVRRQVLGTGYPWFLQDADRRYTKVLLMSGPNHEAGRGIVEIKFGDLGAFKKIKLVAEYVK